MSILTPTQAFMVEQLKDWPHHYGHICVILKHGNGVVHGLRFQSREFNMLGGTLVEQTCNDTDKTWQPHLARCVMSRNEWVLARDLAAIDLMAGRQESPEDPAKEQAEAFPAYWRQLPDSWRYLDAYRVNKLFPLDNIDPSGALTHARKKLLVCGTRTGGKSVRKDLEEAVSTIQCYLRDN